VWATKILTDPFHDIKLYHKAPLHLLRGEWLDTHSTPDEPARAHARAHVGVAARLASLRRRRTRSGGR
jgi:hypothetical protein